MTADGPERPQEDPDAQPPNVASGHGGQLEFSKKVREVGVAPISTHNLSKTTPNELSRHALEEDVVRIFGSATKRAKSGTGAIALADLDPRREPPMDPLPHEDPDLEWQADGPHRRKGGGVVEGAMAWYRDLVENWPDGSRRHLT